MNARLLNFSLCSLCVHVAASWLFMQPAAFEHGIAKMDRVLSVKIIAEEGLQQPVTAQTPADATRTPDPDTSVGKALAPTPSPGTQTSAPASKMHAAAVGDYAVAGRLSKLPAPLSEIDLNVPEISESGFWGEARLTVLIDADGSVADVVSSEKPAGLDEFAERVAARFRSARFLPGEIDGRPVKAQLQITVVSENPATGNAH